MSEAAAGTREVAGTRRRVPGCLFDPLGPLAIPWRHLPRLASRVPLESKRRNHVMIAEPGATPRLPCNLDTKPVADRIFRLD